MFHIDTIGENVFSIKVSGKLTHQDYQADLIPALKRTIIEEDDLNLLIEAQECHGWEWQAAFDDLITGIEYRKKFVKIAIVADQDWKRTLSKLFSFIVPGEVRYFTSIELSAAKAWISL